MRFTIEWMENKTTSTGKRKIDASLKDESGRVTENCSLWEDFPGFVDLQPGSEVVGDLVPARDPKYGPTLYPIRPKVSSTRPTRSPGAITAAMEKKEKSISQFQENKEESIKISSTMRDAVLLTTAQGINGLSDDEVRKRIEAWREWLWFAWDGHGDFPPFPNK